MITDLTRKDFEDLLGTIQKWWYIHGPDGHALRSESDNLMSPNPSWLDITNGQGTGGDSCIDWGFSLARAKAIFPHSDGINPFYDHGDNHGGNANTLVTAMDLRSRVIYIQYAVSGSQTPGAIFKNRYGFINVTAGGFNLGDIVVCRQIDASTYEFVKVNVEIGHTLITSAQLISLINDSNGDELVPHWLYEWNGSAWEKKCQGSAQRCIKIDFTYNGGNKSSATKIPTGAIISRVEIVITTKFDVSNATLSVNGGGITDIMPTSGNHPDLTGIYGNNYTDPNNHKAIASSHSVATVVVTPGAASQGAGYALVYFTEAES